MPRRAAQPTDDPRFQEFWAAYPKKVAKGDAKKAWRALKPDDVLVRQMLAALEWQRETLDWKKQGGQYVPYPASWLRAERWADEMPAAHRPKRAADWREECAQLHGSRCTNAWFHSALMADDKASA